MPHVLTPGRGTTFLETAQAQHTATDATVVTTAETALQSTSVAFPAGTRVAILAVVAYTMPAAEVYVRVRRGTTAGGALVGETITKDNVSYSTVPDSATVLVVDATPASPQAYVVTIQQAATAVNGTVHASAIAVLPLSFL